MRDRYTVIGLMSGTSLDGLDICLTEFSKASEGWGFHILHGVTISYNDSWKARLSYNSQLSATSLLELDHQYGQWLGNQINAFLKNKNLNPKNIDLIASHGHTLYHRPEKGITFQLGSGPEIMNITGIKTVTDFRRQDVILGGQGAPLVPMGDQLLFNQYEACLNLGGFANISFEEDGKRIAYDICPVNYVMNKLAEKEGAEYDVDGAMAGRGKKDEALLNKLNGLEFYQLNPPKSLGAEWVSHHVDPILQKNTSSTIDQLSTLVEHIAVVISNELNRIDAATCLVTGGGSFNSFLMQRIRNHTSCEIIIPDSNMVNYKEAIVFGLLGLLRQRGEINILSSVTGAKSDHSSGLIYSP